MEGKIKILYVLSTDFKTGAGTEKSLYYYIKYADTSKYDITVIDTDLMPGGQRMTEEELGVIKNKIKMIKIKDYLSKLELIKNYPYFYFQHLILTPLLFFILKYTKFRKVIKELGRFDIIYLFENPYSYLFNNGKMIIGSNHTSFDKIELLRQKIYGILINNKLIFPKINGIHLYEFNKEFIKYINNKQIILANSGVDSNLFYPQNNFNNVIKLLFVARLEESKGTRILIDTYNILKNIKKVELYIVGSGPLEDYIRSLTLTDNNIKLFTHVPEIELSRIYRSCDIFVYPTLGDSFSLVVLQALSSGLKVVTTRVIEPVYSDFQEFKVIKFTDPNPAEISKEVINFLEVCINRDEVFNYISNKYSWEKVVKNMYAQFEKILECYDKN